MRDDHLHVQPDEFRYGARELLVGPFGPACIHDEILALDVSELTKAVSQGRKRVRFPSRAAAIAQPAETPHLLRRLRLGGERREREADSENDRKPNQPHGQLGRTNVIAHSAF